MDANRLHVVAAYANPVRWESRERLYRQFEQHMLDSGVNLTTVECAYGERPWVISEGPHHSSHVNYVQVRAYGGALVWNKECLLNIGIAHMPADAKYICWSDADIMHRRADWAREAVHALQHYHVIQPWSYVYDLGPKGEHLHSSAASFCSQHWHRRPMHPGKGGKGHPDYDYAHSGYVWCATRRILNCVGSLIETAGLGAADHHMAWSLIGHADWTIPDFATPGYRRPIKMWEERALRHVNHNIGCLHGYTIEHFWHGRKEERGYTSRWKIFERNHFDPDTDLKRNSWGVIELADNKPQLRHDMDRYMRQRNEDGNIL